MAGLLDFLQSASNTAADTVAAPVDLLAWLLKKGGAPIGEPVGGSDWMRRQGLTKPVKQSPASLAGETVGLLSPVVAAAKGPQIARGLLQAGDNLAAPRTLNPQTGAIVYHGSPHKFDRFDSSKIGTGEGAQAYGHGLYLAESPTVAQTYKNAGTDASTFVPVRSIRDPAQMAATALERAGGDMRHATAVLSQNAQSGDITAGAALQLLKSGKKLPESKYAGALYKVDLPDEKIARMLDWDAPLSKQAHLVPVVQQARPGYMTGGLPNSGIGGADAYLALVEKVGEAKAAEMMRQAGIPGIRYLDGGSRGTGTGTSNFVVFPGEESALKILERNGGLLGQ